MTKSILLAFSVLVGGAVCGVGGSDPFVGDWFGGWATVVHQTIDGVTSDLALVDDDIALAINLGHTAKFDGAIDGTWSKAAGRYRVRLSGGYREYIQAQLPNAEVHKVKLDLIGLDVHGGSVIGRAKVRVGYTNAGITSKVKQHGTFAASRVP